MRVAALSILVVTVGCGRIGFEPLGGADDDGTADASPSAGGTRFLSQEGASILMRALDETGHFTSTLAVATPTMPAVGLAAHPGGAVAYAVSDVVDRFAVGSSTLTLVGTFDPPGIGRPVARAAVPSTGAALFFTLDGVAMAGVMGLPLDAAGVPTGASNATTAPAESSFLALSSDDGLAVVAGTTGELHSYQVSIDQLVEIDVKPSCTDGVDVVIVADRAATFCAQAPGLTLYDLSFVGSISNRADHDLGVTFAGAVPVSGDRVAAIGGSSIYLLDLGAVSPTILAQLPLPGAAVSIASDGAALVVVGTGGTSPQLVTFLVGPGDIAAADMRTVTDPAVPLVFVP